MHSTASHAIPSRPVPSLPFPTHPVSSFPVPSLPSSPFFPLPPARPSPHLHPTPPRSSRTSRLALPPTYWYNIAPANLPSVFEGNGWAQAHWRSDQSTTALLSCTVPWSSEIGCSSRGAGGSAEDQGGGRWKRVRRWKRNAKERREERDGSGFGEGMEVRGRIDPSLVLLLLCLQRRGEEVRRRAGRGRVVRRRKKGTGSAAQKREGGLYWISVLPVLVTVEGEVR